MANKPMKRLFKVWKYTFYWAGNQHLNQGLWVWNGSRNVRVLPLNNFSDWSGSKAEG
jgi:hypothetical protein